MDEGLKLAELEARAALRLDATNTIAYAALAWVFNQRGDVANALEQAEHAIAINPNDPAGHFAKGHILVFARRSEAARSALGTALRLDPRGQAAVGPLHHLAVSHYLDGDYALAEAASRRSILTCPDFPRTYPVLAAALAQLGRPAEAANALRVALSDAPGYFEFLTGRRPPWYRPEDYAHLLDGLRKAGWSTRR